MLVPRLSFFVLFFFSFLFYVSFFSVLSLFWFSSSFSFLFVSIGIEKTVFILSFLGDVA